MDMIVEDIDIRIAMVITGIASINYPVVVVMDVENRFARNMSYIIHWHALLVMWFRQRDLVLQNQG